MISRVAPILFLAAASCLAQERPDLVTDRPDATESSRTVPPGTFQVETGYVHTAHREIRIAGSIDTTMHAANPSVGGVGVLLRWGANEWLEVRGIADLSRERIAPALAGTGLPDATDEAFEWGIGAKVQLLDESGIIPEAALIVHHRFLDGTREMREDAVLSVSHSLPADLGLGYNLGIEFDPKSGDVTPFYTVALGRDLGESFGAFVELFGERSTSEGFSNTFDAGVTWLVMPTIQLDLAGGMGLDERAPRWFVGGGVSVRLPN